MDRVAYWNGRFVPAAEARVPLLAHALQYGTAVVDLIRAHHDAASGESLLFRPLEHCERLERNARLLDIRLPLQAPGLVGVAAELLRVNALAEDALLRVLAFKTAERIDPGLPPGDAFALVAVPAATATGRDAGAKGGLHCGISTWRRPHGGADVLGARAAGAALETALAAHEAHDRGLDEVLVLDPAGRACGGAGTDLFLLLDGRLITPGAADGAPGGLTRDTLLVLARDEMGFEPERRAVDRGELYAADEVFLCGTAAGIAPVVRLDGRPVGAGRPGAAALELSRLLEAVVGGRVPKYRPWLVPAYGYARTAPGPS